MSEWVIPVEPGTGIPLALAPRYDFPSRLQRVEGVADWHHAVYPKDRDSLKGDSGAAVRSARLQFVDYDEHRTYHYYFDEYMAETWDIPQTVSERFGMTVLLAAGYVPKLAIRSRRQGPEYVRLSERGRQLLWEKGLIRVEAEGKMYGFLRDTVLAQQLEVEEGIVEEFLFSTDSRARMQRGNELIVAAADKATEGIREQYRAAYIGRLLLPSQPEEPKDFIVSSRLALGTENRQRRARAALRANLAANLGIELPEAA